MTYEAAQAAVRANPDDAGAWCVLGALEAAEGHAAQARAFYRRALALDPFMQEALAALTRLNEERVMAYARDSLVKEGAETTSPIDAAPVLPSDAIAQVRVERRRPLLALLLLSLGLAGLLYLIFGGPAVEPADRAAMGDNATVPSASTTTELEAASGVVEDGAATAPRSAEVTPTPSLPPSSGAATLLPTYRASVPAVTPEPPPTPTVVSAAGLLERVASAEAALRSGHFHATTRLSADTESSAQVRFDLDRGGGGPRLHLITTYEAPESSQTIEYVIIGERAWQRVEGEAWVETVEQEGVWGRIQRYLPQHERVTDAVIQLDGERAELRWRDSSGELEVTLRVDVTTAIPLVLQEEQTEGGSVTIVRYQAWNTPVEIEPPS